MKQSMVIQNQQQLEERRSPSIARRWLRRLLRSKTGTVGFLIVSLVFLVAFLAPVITPHDPSATNPLLMFKPPTWQEGGEPGYWLGTDNLGRDLLSRIIAGTQITLLVGICSVLVAGVIGILVGLIAGFYGGFIDSMLMRIVDSFLALPNILLTLVVVKILGPSVLTLIFVLGITNWVSYARVIRSEVLSLKEREFVKAARSMGVRNGVILFRHLVPNILPSFIVISTLSVATTIILEASLSFLGLGIQPPDISWGLMLNSGRDYLASSWWVATFPGLAITITVLGIIFLGDWLRDVLDPRSQVRK